MKCRHVQPMFNYFTSSQIGCHLVNIDLAALKLYSEFDPLSSCEFEVIYETNIMQLLMIYLSWNVDMHHIIADVVL